MGDSLVSVIIITYGHEKFIEEAINGVLMQECNFGVELIVANDCSPDNTDEVVQHILINHQRRHWIKYIKHKKNIGMMPNFIFAINKAKNKYIAVCEGDDYWTDPLKLQKQVDFMEANLDFSMCFHPVHITLAGKDDFCDYNTPSSDVLFLKDIVREHYIPTCSLLFRNGYFRNGLPIWFSQSISGDLPLEILLASKGKTKYLTEKMACYRRNEGGITQSAVQLANMRSGYIFMYSKLSKEIGFPHKIYLIYIVCRLRLGYLKIYFKRIKSFFSKL
jgi:glycosyltransferase involved in cell wall biosynthesis